MYEICIMYYKRYLIKGCYITWVNCVSHRDDRLTTTPSTKHQKCPLEWLVIVDEMNPQNNIEYWLVVSSKRLKIKLT